MTGGSQQAVALGKLMSRAWTNFARTGDPNPLDIPKWEPYTKENGNTMIFDDKCSLQSHATQAITAVYADFASISFNYVFLKNTLGDDYWSGGGGRGDNNQLEQMNEYTFDASHSYLSGIFQSYYSVIYRCNVVLDKVPADGSEVMPNTNPGAELSPVYKDIDNQVKVQFSKNPKLYWIGIGSADFLINANDEYRAKLDSAGFKYTYYPTGKGHIWENWRIYLSQFAPLCFK